MKRKLPLTWNVYVYSFNSNELEAFNVFEHRSFGMNIEKLLKEKISKEEFEARLRGEAQYYYWGKCEWECIITRGTPHIDCRELQRLIDEYYLKRTPQERPVISASIRLADKLKIDVYEQLLMNWNEFVEYVWSHSKASKSI